jgi:hypothetical protein
MRNPGKYFGPVFLVIVLNALILSGCGKIEFTIENPSHSTPTTTSTPSIEYSSGSTPTAGSTTTPRPYVTPVTPEPSEENADPIRIIFGEGDTTWTLEDGLKEGDINHFVLYALEGQTMSLIARPNGTQLTIQGEDGTILNNIDDYNSFWRGVLPATQDYLIELDPTQSGADQVSDRFYINVAVAPPGQTQQFFAYTDRQAGFMLEYSDHFAVDPSPDIASPTKGAIVLTLDFIGTDFYTDTNLSAAHIYVAVSHDPDVVNSCTEPDLQEEIGDTVEVNGIAFQQSSFQGVGLGNIYERTNHRTENGDACYEIVFFLHYNSIGVFPDGSVREFDASQIRQLMHEVLNRFEFLLE